MSMTDPIADLLTRIRNASKAKQTAADVPASRMKREIVRILKEHKYIKDYVELPDTRQGILRVYLKYSREDK
ncbi:MAG: 30S ribosomal protein S8, partial [candidate division Zixibacteria bacterium]|nr:30S ribosomal protein S8 [candidate division Zixibacteria bacterium]